MLSRTKTMAVVAVIALSALCVGVILQSSPSDADTPSIEIQNIEAAPNSDVQLEVYIKNNPGITDIQIEFLLNENLEVKKVKSDLVDIQDTSRSGYKFNVIAHSADEMKESGTLMTLTIHIPDIEPNELFNVYAQEVTASSPESSSIHFDKGMGIINVDLPDADNSGSTGNNHMIIGAVVAVIAVLIAAVVIIKYKH